MAAIRPNSFDVSTDIAWLSIPGQIALSSYKITPPIETLISNTYAGTFGVHAADFDGDGDTDVVGASQFSGYVSIWWNEGGYPISWSEQKLDSLLEGAQDVCPADIDGDGDIDIVGNAVDPQNKIVWWRNDGGDPVVWTRFAVQLVWPSSYEIHVADVDLDGLPDILSTSWSRGEVAWWRNNGGDPVTWTKQTVDAFFGGAHSVMTGDFDGDGDVDLAGAAGVDNEIAWWRNDGGSPFVWTRLVIRTGFTGARSISVGDIDGDGDEDIAGTCWTSHVSWWRNDGGDPVVWTEQTVDSLWSGGHHIDIADLNGDGHLDILSVAYSLDDIKWWGNDGGDPITWTMYNVDRNFNGAIKACATDLDGDGAFEILGSSYTLGEFAWYEIVEFDTVGMLTSTILDAAVAPSFSGIDWTSVDPAGTSLSIRVRSSNDPGDLGSWSAAMTGPGDFATPLQRYVQYQVLMETTDLQKSSILKDVAFLSDCTGVGSVDSAPRIHTLQNRPNPFNPETTISFRLEGRGHARLAVYDTAGREVVRLVDERLPAGDHSVIWRGAGRNGSPLSSGIYLVRLETEERTETRKAVLVR